MNPLWENVNDVSRLLRTIDKPVPCGALADTDIWDAIYRGEIYISPFHSENLTAADYNLQVSDIIISTRSGLPLKYTPAGSIGMWTFRQMIRCLSQPWKAYLWGRRLWEPSTHGFPSCHKALGISLRHSTLRGAARFLLRSITHQTGKNDL